MRQDYTCDIRRCQPNFFECCGQSNRLRVIPLVNRFIAQPDANVHQDRSLGMSDDPCMYGKWSENFVLGVPFRY